MSKKPDLRDASSSAVAEAEGGGAAEGAEGVATQRTTLAEKNLPTKCKDGALFRYCPTMDLIALATEDERLCVFRFNGQEVLSVDLAGDPYLDDVKGEIRGIRWKEDGRLLAVADAENKIRIVNSYTGKTIHHFSCLSSGQDQYSVGQSPSTSTNMNQERQKKEKKKKNLRITCIGWGVNFTDPKAAQSHLRDGNGEIIVDDLLSPDTDPVKAAMQLKADLPRDLALLDVESSLPRLSTLAGTGGDEDVFSNRSSLDAIFQSFNKITSDTVDVLFVGLSDGQAHLRIFDCFEIGNFSINTSKSQSSPYCCEALVHASHPMSSTHAILVSERAEDSSPPTAVLKVVSLDLRFITKSGRYVSLLAFKITQLQNLLRYINQTQRQIALEWKNIYELPARFMRSISEELQNKCHCDFVTALYHLVVTGNCFPPMKDFLVDIVGERGHKRWEKTVSSGYENLRRLTHECLLPALERCEVVLSRLIGMSKFHKVGPVLGLETRDLQNVVETLDCLHLLSHSILTKSGRELNQFLEFAKWLRHEIDIQTAEPMSQTLEELLEKTDLIDHSTTLEYIEGPLTRSALHRYISPTSGMAVSAPAGAESQTRVSDGEKQSFYQAFKNALSVEKVDKPWDPPVPSGSGNNTMKNDLSRPPNLPQLGDLISRLELQSTKVFDKIALTQKRSILHRCIFTLHPDCDADVSDIVMYFEDVDKGDEYTIYVGSRLKSARNTFLLYRITIQCTNGVSSTTDISVTLLRLPEGEIQQIQFAGDGIVALLYSRKEGSYILNFVVSTNFHADFFDVGYIPKFTPVATDSQSSLPNPDDFDPFQAPTENVFHVFPKSGPKSKPVRIDYNPMHDRQAIIVLYTNMMYYEVLHMDEIVDDKNEDENRDD